MANRHTARHWTHRWLEVWMPKQQATVWTRTLLTVKPYATAFAEPVNTRVAGQEPGNTKAGDMGQTTTGTTQMTHMTQFETGWGGGKSDLAVRPPAQTASDPLLWGNGKRTYGRH